MTEEKPLNFKSWIGKDITKEKPLKEKIKFYPNMEPPESFTFFWSDDVAHAVDRLKEELRHGLTGWKDKINEIFGDLK